MIEFWVHPALILILGGALLPLVPERFRKAYLMLIPVLTFLRTAALAQGRLPKLSSWNGNSCSGGWTG
jgi:multicomponent Na+:H+ antiporter subunit D